MSTNFARLLDDQDKIQHFLTKVLNVDTKKFPRIYYNIETGENGIIKYAPFQTLNHTQHRDRKYVEEGPRNKLRRRIVDELFTEDLLENDDHIKLGVGGAFLENLRRQKQAYIVIGLPASGKSSIAKDIAVNKGAMILDADFAKRKLPEYKNYVHGSTIVHAESIDLIFGFHTSSGVSSLYELAVENKYNIVIPKVGNNAKAIIDLGTSLKEMGYSVHLTLVSLTKQQATIRALHRFYETKRYVPLSMIFDEFSNDPIMTYYFIKNCKFGCFDSYGAVSTNVQKGHAYRRIDLQGSNPARLYAPETNVLKLM